MPCAKKILCVTDLRHAEYYGMLDTFDMLYQKSKDRETARKKHDASFDSS